MFDICTCISKKRVLLRVNTQSSFTVQNPRAQLVKIDHVILLYLSSANSDSAVLTIPYYRKLTLVLIKVFEINAT